MKFLSLLAVLALVQVASAQTFPLTSLGITTSTSGVAQPQLIPSFSQFGQSSLRYAAQINSASPVTVSVSWASNQITSLVWRNCGSTLTTIASSASIYSYCQFSTATTVSTGTAVSVSNLLGTNFIELATVGTLNGLSVNYNYVINVYVVDPSNNQGTNMLTLEPNSAQGHFQAPFTGAQSQYSVSYFASTTASQIQVPFFLGAQTSVSIIFVQECPGITCDSCSLSTTQRQITSPSTTSITPVGSNGNGFNSGVQPQSGEYIFPAINGNNCVRFINQVTQAGGGTNQNTITISLSVDNCGAYTSCVACATDANCGWCVNNIFSLTGTCRYGNSQQALDGGTACVANSNLNVVPRWLFNPSQCTIVLRGDPRISGLQGQDFQVHGTPNEYFNLVSTASLQVNSRFVFLDDARCDNFTTCFTHPGTYIDEIGVMMGENKVRLTAGPITEAARVFINGKEIMVSNKKHTAGKVTVIFANSRRAVIKTPEIMMTISQSDKFFNVDSALLTTSLLDQGSKLVKLDTARAASTNSIMHGLIGQTWLNNVYAGDREYEGEVSDYQVADGLWGSDFTFNLYKN